MTATFLLPFAMGACEALGGNIITDAFGVVAMTPLITIQVMGMVFKLKESSRRRVVSGKAGQVPLEAFGDMEIIEL